MSFVVGDAGVLSVVADEESLALDCVKPEDDEIVMGLFKRHCVD